MCSGCHSRLNISSYLHAICMLARRCLRMTNHSHSTLHSGVTTASKQRQMGTTGRVEFNQTEPRLHPMNRRFKFESPLVFVWGVSRWDYFTSNIRAIHSVMRARKEEKEGERETKKERNT